MCDYETIESVNEELYHNLHELVNTPFFKYFQVRMFPYPRLVVSDS
jgi:ERO1-like protein beta